MVQPFRRRSSNILLDRRVFRLRSDVVEHPRTGRTMDASVLEASDWCNIIPVTPDGQVVLIRQWRHGTREITLEIPGGIVDPGEEPGAAAARELLEETGYRAGTVQAIGRVSPNPAIMDNTTWSFLALGVEPAAAASLDEGEDIDVVLHPLSGVPALIQRGEITHALVIAAFLHLANLAGGRLGALPG